VAKNSHFENESVRVPDPYTYDVMYISTELNSPYKRV